MAIELYVDSLDENETLGITANELSVSYNLVMLNNFNLDASAVFTAGRYFCMVWETSPPSITFVDIIKKPEVVNTIIYAPEFDDSYRAKFSSLLENYNSTYDSKKDEVKLIKGESPG